jgi:probable F420-dependent oxidoreductase
MALEFGVLYDFRNPPGSGLSDAEVYAETMDHIAAVEHLGFDVVWITEHHFIDDAYLPSVLPMCAAVAMRTSRITIGTAVLLLPLHDPLRIAEDSAVVDVLSNGRFRLGVGLGYKLQEFEVFGKDRRQRPSMLEEGIAVMRGAWADEPLTFEGRHYRYRDVNVTPKPVQRPGIPVWLAGRAEAPVRRAARIGDGTIVTAGFDIFATYLGARDEYGRTGPANLCTFAFTYPAADPERAMAELGAAAGYRMANYVQWYGQAGDLAEDRALLDLPSGGALNVPFFADLATVKAQLAELEAAGVTSVLWFGTVPGVRPSATLPMFEMIASIKR